MTFEGVIQKLDADARIESRFPVRLIMTDSLSDYRRLVVHLEKADKTSILNIGDFCAGDDKYPVKAKLDEKLISLGEVRIVLKSISEYLRIAIEKEKGTQRLFIPLWEMQQSQSSKRRIIIPLFSAKEIFEMLVPKIDQRQIDFIWQIEGVQDKRFDISFCSQNFQNIFEDATDGIKAWLANWDSLFAKDAKQKVITSLYDRITKSASVVYVDKKNDIFSYLQEISKGVSLVREWGTNEKWAHLAAAHKEAMELGATIDKKLNVSNFDPFAILPRWKSMTAEEKWLTWLRFRFFDGKDYISHVFKKAFDANRIEDELRFSIFDLLADNPFWAGDYRKAMFALDADASDIFISKLSDIEDINIRLSLLTCKNHKEKTYAIRIAAELIRQGKSLNEVAAMFVDLYKELSVYLCSEAELQEDLRSYFDWYRMHKVANSFEENSNLLSQVNLDKFSSRHSKISEFSQQKDLFLFWFDGMGIEWLPLFMYFVGRESDEIKYSYDVCAARIPTEAEHNEQWFDYKPNAEKKDKLDKLAHNGMPDDNDYFSCIATQIEYISGFAKLVVDKLKVFNTVIVSADHGSSRLAARAFHAMSGITAPSSSVVKGHGRYCEFSTEPTLSTMPTCAEYETREVAGKNKYFFVMNTHDHFAQGGKAVIGANDQEVKCGEIHGGKTPEEFLVPVMVFERTKKLVVEEIIDAPKRGLMRNTDGDL